MVDKKQMNATGMAGRVRQEVRARTVLILPFRTWYRMYLYLNGISSVAVLDLGSWMGKKSRSGIRIRDEPTGLYFRELGNNFLS
jgi:hypothetical protein